VAKICIEMSPVEYWELISILEEVSKYSGTSTALIANSLLSKIKRGLIKVNTKEDKYEIKFMYTQSIGGDNVRQG